MIAPVTATLRITKKTVIIVESDAIKPRVQVRCLNRRSQRAMTGPVVADRTWPHLVDIQVASADTILIHNSNSTTQVGNDARLVSTRLNRQGREARWVSNSPRPANFPPRSMALYRTYSKLFFALVDSVADALRLAHDEICFG